MLHNLPCKMSAEALTAAYAFLIPGTVSAVYIVAMLSGSVGHRFKLQLLPEILTLLRTIEGIVTKMFSAKAVVGASAA